jgi:hypothetical protein
MAFSADEQTLYDWLRSSLPSWMFQDDAASEEIWGAIVKALHPVRAQVDSWRAALEILQAEGAWLNQHARDRGTFRQEDETNEALRSRLRTVEDAITLPALKLAINRVLEATGLASLITVPAGGWRYRWNVEASWVNFQEVTVPAGDYTLSELLRYMNEQFHVHDDAPTDSERAWFYFDDTTTRVVIDNLPTTTTSNIYVEWIDTDLRDALGFPGEISDGEQPYPYSATNAPDGYQNCAIVELRKRRGFFMTYTELDSVLADNFELMGNDVVRLTGMDMPPELGLLNMQPNWVGSTITLTGSTSAGNDGTYVIIAVGVDEFGEGWVEYYNPEGVAEAHVGAWEIDADWADRKAAYFSRGYRMTRQFTANPSLVAADRAAHSFIVILPYGTTAATALAVEEALRQKRAGGILAWTERRLNP